MKVKRLFVDRYGTRVWVVIVSLVLAASAVAGATSAIMRRADSVRCRNKAAAMHRAYHSGFLEGCMVRLDDGTYIPLGNLRANDVERSR